MNDFVIVTDSSADLPNELVQNWGVPVLPLSFLIDGVTYRNLPDNRDMSPTEFYSRLRKGAMPTTNAVVVGEAEELVRDLASQGKDVLLLCFSSGLSASYNAMKIAADTVSDEFPQRRIYAVDTLSASLGQGILVYHAVKMREEGKTIEEVRDWALENGKKVCHWVTVDDLMHLKRGGRISAATALVGSLLSVKPVIHMNDEGKLINVGKARGRKASLDLLVKKVQDHCPNPESQVLGVAHADCADDAAYVERKLRDAFGTKEILVNNFGPVIGSHTGPGCIAVIFMGEHR